MDKTIELTTEITADLASELHRRRGEVVQVVGVEFDSKTGRAVVQLRMSDGTMMTASPAPEN